MPYKSEAQRKYFNANRKKLEAEGVDVAEWNSSSKGKKLPEKAKKTAAAIALLKLAESKDESVSSRLTDRLAQFSKDKSKDLLSNAIGLTPFLGSQMYAGRYLMDPGNPYPTQLHGGKKNALINSWFKSEKARGAASGIPADKLGIKLEGGRPAVASTGRKATYTPAHYDPWDRTVSITKRMGRNQDHKLGILAHELGHAEQYRKSNPTSKNWKSLFGGRNRGILEGIISHRLAPLVGVAGPSLTSDEGTAQTYAALGTLGQAPILASEFGASARGSRTLVNYAKKSGLWKNKSALEKLKFAGKSWTGVPTYLLTAAIALATYLGYKATGGYAKRPENNISNEISNMLARKKN